MPDAAANTTGWGLIAGNGRFPFLVLEGARSQGIEMAVIALKEEASAELERSAKRLHWVSLGELSKAIDLMHHAGSDGRASEAQQDFQRGPAGLEVGKAVVFAAAKKHGFTDWRGCASARG